jgi:membrane protein YqaA with SNARE-associated domain
VVFENSDNSLEKFFKMLWQNFHYTYIILLFLTLIPSIMTLQSGASKLYLGIITTIIVLGCSAMKYYGGILEILKKLFKV